MTERLWKADIQPQSVLADSPELASLLGLRGPAQVVIGRTIAE